MKKEKSIIIGAGGAGEELLEELIHKDKFYNYDIFGFLDDDNSKQGKFIKGVQVVGKINNLPELIKKQNISTVLIAIPSGSGKLIRKIFSICSKSRVKIKIIPRLSEIINGRVNYNQIKDISVEDLLGRSVIKQDIENIKNEMQNKTVLISGAAGSIGSELCKNCLILNPAKIVCVDNWENGMFALQEKLIKVKENLKHKNSTKIIYSIGNIRDAPKIDSLFRYNKPDMVFNAAAYKHVPLMEENIDQAILNNILGTKNLCEAAMKWEVKKFVLISTDKAVNPTSVMGATKRATEKLMHYFSNLTNTTIFSAVRFGNVLNSNGSVIPTFQQQIDEGVLTVTHKDIVRYFMTINEAAQLVLQCWSQSKGNEIFVLDMGEPVRILDLAELMIRLRGLEPYMDVKIKIIGLRRGEKLYEEPLTEIEKVNATINNKIFIVAKKERMNKKVFIKRVENIIVQANSNKPPVKLKKLLRGIVPTYKLAIK